MESKYYDFFYDNFHLTNYSLGELFLFYNKSSFIKLKLIKTRFDY